MAEADLLGNRPAFDRAVELAIEELATALGDIARFPV